MTPWTVRIVAVNCADLTLGPITEARRRRDQQRELFPATEH